MAKNTIYDYSTAPGSNTDIAGIGVLGTNAVSNFDDAFRTIMAHIAADVSPRRLSIQGALYGLTLSNNSGDATNDIDIAVGMATTDSTTDPRTMVLSSILTKRLDAAWAVGTNQGGLDTGAIANTTYHIWLIQRSDTGVVDALFSTSATAPTMPTNYDRKRRIGSVIRSAGAILAFRQIGNRFLLAAQIDIRSSTAGASNILVNTSAPLGIRTRPIFFNQLIVPVAADIVIFLGDGDNATAQFVVQRIGSSTSTAADGIVLDFAYTDLSQQVRYTAQINGGTITSNIFRTLGWWDDRGINV